MDERDGLIVGTQLPLWARQHNMRIVRGVQRREKFERDAKAKVFWDRCWAALCKEMDVWLLQVGKDSALAPSQAAADTIMDWVAALPAEAHATFAGAEDAHIQAFMAHLVQRYRAQLAPAERIPQAGSAAAEQPNPAQGGEAKRDG